MTGNLKKKPDQFRQQSPSNCCRNCFGRETHRIKRGWVKPGLVGLSQVLRHFHISKRHTLKWMSRLNFVMCLLRHAYVYMCMWSPEGNLSCHSSSDHLLKQGLSLAGESPIKLDWLAKELQGFACLCLNRSVLQTFVNMSGFLHRL